MPVNMGIVRLAFWLVPGSWLTGWLLVSRSRPHPPDLIYPFSHVYPSFRPHPFPLPCLRRRPPRCCRPFLKHMHALTLPSLPTITIDLALDLALPLDPRPHFPLTHALPTPVPLTLSFLTPLPWPCPDLTHSHTTGALTHHSHTTQMPTHHSRHSNNYAYAPPWLTCLVLWLLHTSAPIHVHKHPYTFIRTPYILIILKIYVVKIIIEFLKI